LNNWSYGSKARGQTASDSDSVSGNSSSSNRYDLCVKSSSSSSTSSSSNLPLSSVHLLLPEFNVEGKEISANKLDLEKNINNSNSLPSFVITPPEKSDSTETSAVELKEEDGVDESSLRPSKRALGHEIKSPPSSKRSSMLKSGLLRLPLSSSYDSALTRKTGRWNIPIFESSKSSQASEVASELSLHTRSQSLLSVEQAPEGPGKYRRSTSEPCHAEECGCGGRALCWQSSALSGEYKMDVIDYLVSLQEKVNSGLPAKPERVSAPANDETSGIHLEMKSRTSELEMDSMLETPEHSVPNTSEPSEASHSSKRVLQGQESPAVPDKRPRLLRM